jgi:hypothetical protein
MCDFQNIINFVVHKEFHCYATNKLLYLMDTMLNK